VCDHATAVRHAADQDRRITFTRSRPGNKNDGCHVEQKNWAVVRTIVGYYDTATTPVPPHD
jgi:hypothetical protein